MPDGGIIIATEIANQTMVTMKIRVFVGNHADSVLRVGEDADQSSRMMVVPPCTAHTALMMAVAAVLR